jgi:cell division septum initiation protein DivIVA
MREFERKLDFIKSYLDDLENMYRELLTEKEVLEEQLEDRDNIINEKNDEIYELKQRLKE